MQVIYNNIRPPERLPKTKKELAQLKTLLFHMTSPKGYYYNECQYATDFLHSVSKQLKEKGAISSKQLIAITNIFNNARYPKSYDCDYAFN
jgi:hypothetical protein